MLVAFESVSPGSFGTFRTVDYVDPYLPKPPIDIRFVKHFRFAYRKKKDSFGTQSAFEQSCRNLDQLGTAE